MAIATSDILKKVRRIEIVTNRFVNDIMAGEYHSVFKGRGMEFDEVREYQFGDEIRAIDWNVTARMGRPHVKRFVEERELTVMLVVDASSSFEFGTTSQMKGELAAEMCALFAFSAIKNNDRVGLLVFTDQVEKFIPPQKGRKHVLRVIREMLMFEPEHRKTDIPAALEYLNKVLTRKSVVFLISDFPPGVLKKPLSIANRRHDLIAITITDPREMELTGSGLIELEDAETGEVILVDTFDSSVQREFTEINRQKRGELFELFRSLGIDYVNVMTNQDYVAPIIRLFRQRARRY